MTSLAFNLGDTATIIGSVLCNFSTDLPINASQKWFKSF